VRFPTAFEINDLDRFQRLDSLLSERVAGQRRDSAGTAPGQRRDSAGAGKERWRRKREVPGIPGSPATVFRETRVISKFLSLNSKLKKKKQTS